VKITLICSNKSVGYGGYQIVARFCFLKNAFDFAFWLLILIFPKNRKITQKICRPKKQNAKNKTLN
jgi:hypothetical protein